LFNLLDEDYRPVWAPDLPAVRPRTPTRRKAFMYACALVAAKMEGKVDETAANRVPRRTRRRDG
jgi:hypothetical protein